MKEWRPIAVRLRDAPKFVGMGRTQFEECIRPRLKIVEYSERSKQVDYEELMRAWEAYKRETLCEENTNAPESTGTKKPNPGTSKRSTSEPQSGSLVELLTRTKPRNT